MLDFYWFHFKRGCECVSELLFYTLSYLFLKSSFQRDECCVYLRCNLRELKFHSGHLWRPIGEGLFKFWCTLLHLIRSVYKIGQTIMENSKRVSNAIPTDVILDRAKHYKQAIEARKSILPSASETFSSQWNRLRHFGIKNIMGAEGAEGLVLRSQELDVGSLGTNTVKYFDVPLFEERSCAAIDDRINPVSSKMRQRKCHTGAVEIGIDSLASGTSDLVLGAVLYDKRHQNPRNAVKGAFCTSLASRNTRVLVYPDHHVSLMNNPNKSLELAIISPNNDMRSEDILAHIKVRAVSQIVASDTQSSATKALINLSGQEKMSVVKYFDTNCVHFIPTEQKFSLPNLSIPIVHGFKMRQVDNCTWVQESIKDKNFTLTTCGTSEVGTASVSDEIHAPGACAEEFHNNAEATKGKKLKGKMTYAEGQANVSGGISEQFLEVQRGPTINEQLAHLHTEIFVVDLTVVAGKVIVDMPINKLIKAEGNYSKYLEVILRNRGALRVRIQCNSTSTSGIALKAGFVPASPSFSSNMPPNMFNELDAVTWNPATGDSADITFNPIICAHSWNPYTVGSFDDEDVPRFIVIALTGWIQAPDNGMRGTMSVYIDNTVECTPRIYKPYELSGLKFGKYLGELKFDQGANNVGYWCDASLGNPGRYGTQYFYTLETSLLGLYRYYKSDLIFEFVRASSPFLCGNFVCSLLPYDVGMKVTADTIFRYNHVQFSVTGSQSKYTVKFPWELNGMWQSTDQWNPFSDLVDKPSLVLVIFSVGSINSNLAGKMCLTLSMYPGTNLEGLGLTAGYPSTKKRGTFKDGDESTPTKVITEKNVRAEGQFSISRNKLDLDFFQDICRYKPASNAKGKAVATVLFGGFQSVGFEMLDTPMTRILKTSTWLSGTIRFRVQWVSKNVQWSERSATYGIFVHETRRASNCLYRHFSHVPSGEAYFDIECNGPHEGFMNTRWKIAGEKRSTLIRFTAYDVEDLSAVYISACFGDDFYVSGSADVELYQSTESLGATVGVFKEKKMFETD